MLSINNKYNEIEKIYVLLYLQSVRKTENRSYGEIVRVNNYRLFILEKEQSSKLYYHITVIFIQIWELLLLSRFSSLRLCDTIDGSPPGFPVPGILQARTLEWVAISFSNAWKWKVNSESEAAQSCPTLRNAKDCSLPGCSIHGIFQARVLDWLPIAFPDLCIELKTIHKTIHNKKFSLSFGLWYCAWIWLLHFL